MSVGQSVGWSDGNAFVKMAVTRLFVVSELRAARRNGQRGRRSDEKESATRRKEQRGGRSDEKGVVRRQMN